MEKMSNEVVNGVDSEMQNKFFYLHNEIIFCGSCAAENIVLMCKKLKQMRDEKLFENGGYNTFADYVEQALGIKSRQAYKYIKVFEDLPSEFLHSNAKIGISKLELLSSVPDKAQKIVVENNVEKISVKELKSIIAEKEGIVKKLENKIKTVSNDEQNKFNDEINKIKTEKESVCKKLEAAKEEKTKLLNQIKKLEENPKEITVDNSDTLNALATAELNVSKLSAEVEKLNKQLVVSSDVNMIKFKIKFEEFQKIGNELLSLFSEFETEKGDKCRAAFKAVIEGWNL